MAQDVTKYVSACPTCARNKRSNKVAAGILNPLLTPGHPWSHVSLDFVTGLPTLEGYTVTLTVVDQFSKLVHFIPGPNLPTAKVFLQQVVCLHDFPVDVF